jgi:hypothetical protein
LLALQCAPACPVHGGTCHHPIEATVPTLRFYTQEQEGTRVPWNDGTVLQVEDANGAVRPSLRAFLFDAVNKNVEASTMANSTTPILLTLHASIGSIATLCRSSCFLPGTSFHSNSVGCQIQGVLFQPNSVGCQIQGISYHSNSVGFQIQDTSFLPSSINETTQLANLPIYMQTVARGDVTRLCEQTRKLNAELKASGEKTLDLVANVLAALEKAPNPFFVRL